MSSSPTPSKDPFDDVRMRGFRSRKRVDEVLAWIDRVSNLMTPETVALRAAAGRVLSDEIASTVDVPAFDRAMMDGFALRAEDTSGATTYNSLRLKVVGSVLPGRFFSETIHPGEAVSIMTGAPMPNGANAVLPAEKVSRSGSILTVFDEVPPEKHVGKVGEDIQSGTMILPRYRRLRPQDLGVLSSVGHAHVNVVRRPRVRLVVTGDELCDAGAVPDLHQTVDANSPMLSALIQRDGGELLFDGITPDRPDAIQQAMEDPSADVVVVSGGSSVGQEDHAPKILSNIGELAIHGVAMRPSSPTGMGRISERLVFLLPGNPVSCLCAYDFFAGRAIRICGGREPEWPYQQTSGTLKRKISSVVGRHDYARVAVDSDRIEPIAIAGASVLSSTSRADGFVIIPADSEGYPPDTEVTVFLYG